MKLTELLSKITPLPYSVSGESIVKGDDICIAVIEDDGGYQAPHEQREANAAYLVLAANMLPELIDELNRLLDCVGETDAKIILAVLARAENVEHWWCGACNWHGTTEDSVSANESGKLCCPKCGNTDVREKGSPLFKAA